jgi:hypothetical protein
MRYVVTGRVHPERANISFSRIEWQIQGDGRAIASCDASQITVVLEFQSIDGWTSAFIAAEQLAHIMVCSLGFSLGSGYSVELIQVTEEDGTPHVFGVRPKGSAPDQTLGFEPYGPVLNRAFQLANRNIFFRLALRDYLRAINDMADCATYCFRAIESIKSSFVSKTGVDRWDDMHRALGTDRASITATVKDFAVPIRHGNWVNAKSTDGVTRWKMLQLTRDILIKYLDHENPAT